ncbi:MAG TPA: nuclear transport factor 2 family protein [Saprospiraceae bacterium]|nr:nuclear transport factor 2 family protein [Saprospiraceae bacterium]HMP25130.1 nuclear transport factor 2 family protein [Saprospiraceae bacterium]
MKSLCLFYCLFTIGSIVAQTNTEQQIRATWDAFIMAWEQGDAAACAAFYTEDGLNVPPGFKENKGRAEIEAFYAFLFTNHASSKYAHRIGSLQLLGNYAVEYGHFEVNWTRKDDSTWDFTARSLTVWEKQGDSWKIRQLMFNNPPE